MYYVMIESGTEKGDSLSYTIFTNEEEMIEAMDTSPYTHVEVCEFETREELLKWFAEGIFLPLQP